MENFIFLVSHIHIAAVIVFDDDCKSMICFLSRISFHYFIWPFPEVERPKAYIICTYLRNMLGLLGSWMNREIELALELDQEVEVELGNWSVGELELGRAH